jgi:hypothetical protein
MMILMERTQMEKILIVFYKMTLMMAMVAMGLLMMLGMVMTVMVIPIADMTVATIEAVILQSMTSTRKPQREAMHILLGLLPPELMRLAHLLLALTLKKVKGIGKECLLQPIAKCQMKLTLHNLIVIPQQ